VSGEADGDEVPPRWRLSRTELLLVAASVLGSLLVYAPFWNHMAEVYRLWDGPNYLNIARTLYDVKEDNPLLTYVYEPSYFLVHLPVYPLLIRLFSFLGYQHSMLFVSIACCAIATVLFHRLCRDVWKIPQPGFLTLVFLFLPPRWLLYRGAGSTESTYLLFLLLSMSAFERGRVGRASLWGGLATLTRIPGLMLVPAFGVLLLQRKRWREIPWLALIALPLALYFGFCWTRTGNYLHYLSVHSDKLAPKVPFGFIGTFFAQGLYHQVEFYILLGLVYAVGVTRLREMKLETPFAYCFFVYLLLVFVATEDWSRYWLAMAPFALIVGFHDILTTKSFRWLLPVFAFLGYVYAWGSIPLNGCRIDVYAHLLWNIGLWSEWHGP